jgi:anaphase-promoting complex subunit 10
VLFLSAALPGMWAAFFPENKPSFISFYSHTYCTSKLVCFLLAFRKTTTGCDNIMTRRPRPDDFDELSADEGEGAILDESLETEDEADLARDEEEEEGGEAAEGEEEGEEGEEELADGSRMDDHGVLFFRGVSSTESVEALKKQFQLRDIGHEAVWSLSTAKPGNGVDQIRDGSVDTYWQSDGSYPHLINIQFRKRVSVSSVAFFLDYNLDESYTPKQICVRSGITTHDLADVQMVDLTSPVGWINIPLRPPMDPLDEILQMGGEEQADDSDPLNGGRPLRAFFIQIVVLSMHQNGRDTHVRQVKIFGPRGGASSASQHLTPFAMPEFKTLELSPFTTTVR